MASAEFLKARVPELERCPMQATSKGCHFLFARPSWADAEGYYDGARQNVDHVDERIRSLLVDFKTVCSTFTGRGVLVVSPSVGKEWVRPPWSSEFKELPRELVDLVAKKRPQSVIDRFLGLKNGTITKQEEKQFQVKRRRQQWIPVAREDLAEFINSDDPVVVLLRTLSQDRWDNYPSWLSIAMILKHEFKDTYYDVWNELSKSSMNYDEEASKRTWASIDEDYPGVRRTMGSLRYWARIDSELDDIVFDNNGVAEVETDEVGLAGHAAMPNLSTNPSSTEGVAAGTFDATNQFSGDNSRPIRKMVTTVMEDMGISRHLGSCADVDWSKDTTQSINNGVLDVGVMLGSRTLQDGAKYDCNISMNTTDLFTKVTMSENVICERFMNALLGKDVGINKLIDKGQTWDISRPRPSEVVFTGSGNTTCHFYNFNDPGREFLQLCIRNGGLSQVSNIKSQSAIKQMYMFYNDAVKQTLVDRLGLGWLVINGNNNNVSVNILPPPDTDFVIVRDKLLLFAKQNGLRKLDGFVYEPYPACPCAYKQLETYTQFINRALADDGAYRRNPKRFDEVMKFLTNYTLKEEMPDYVPDKDLISFANGLLSLSTMIFEEYDTMSEDKKERVARHHIHKEYTGSSETPLLDTILNVQFDDTTVDILCALFGRLLFEVGELDNWQVMPYLVGEGGTGKSLLLTVISKLFRPSAVGNLAYSREEIFGLSSLYMKEVVIGRDMPEQLSKALGQNEMQSMTTGEDMCVSRKATSAINIRWIVALILSSNYMPDYVNKGNSVARRIALFGFDTPVKNPDEGLERAILENELPMVLCKFVTAYHRLRERVGTDGQGDFWRVMPVTIKRSKVFEQHGDYKPLVDFLNMSAETRGCEIKMVPGAVTWVHDLQKVYLATKLSTVPLQFKDQYESNIEILASRGFNFRKSQNVCQSCRKIAKARGGKCCEQYAYNNRIMKDVIINMQLTVL